MTLRERNLSHKITSNRHVMQLTLNSMRGLHRFRDSRPTNPQIDSQVLHIEANFWQKVAATWGFCPAAALIFPCYSNVNFNRL